MNYNYYYGYQGAKGASKSRSKGMEPDTAAQHAALYGYGHPHYATTAGANPYLGGETDTSNS